MQTDLAVAPVADDGRMPVPPWALLGLPIKLALLGLPPVMVPETLHLPCPAAASHTDDDASIPQTPFPLPGYGWFPKLPGQGSQSQQCWSDQVWVALLHSC